MSFLWKPDSDSDGNAVVLLPSKYSGNVETVTVVGPDGTVLDSPRFTGFGNPDNGGNRGHYRLPKPGRSYPSGTKVIVKLNNGEEVTQEIGSPGSRVEAPDLGEGANVTASAGGGVGGAEGGGVQGGVAFPYDLSSQFPSAVTINYQPIQAAPYKYTNPMEFAKEFAEFNRGEFSKNVIQSKEFALDALDTELQGLQRFVPKAAATKRFETAADNVFNQQERTKQIQSAIPDVLADQDVQAADARAYAEGRLPDSVLDSSLNLATRSEAADIASASGFGSRSSVARKTSDLMSARERFGISQYGNQLKSQSIADRANLRLAPTSYSDAGQQMRVMPTVSGAQLQTAYGTELNRATMIDPSTGLSTEVAQQQFSTNLNQETNKFNATNTLATDQFNANNLNKFALDKFDYQAQFANAYQQATQGTLNIQREDAIREQNKDIFLDFLNKAQKAGDRKALASGLAQIFQSFGGVDKFMDLIKDTFGSSTDTQQGDPLDIDLSDDDVNSIDDLDEFDIGGEEFDANPNDVDTGPEVDLSDPNFETPEFDATRSYDNPYDSSDLLGYETDMGYR